MKLIIIDTGKDYYVTKLKELSYKGKHGELQKTNQTTENVKKTVLNSIIIVYYCINTKTLN